MAETTGVDDEGQRQRLEGDASLGCGVVLAARSATHAVAAVPAGVAAEGLRVELVCLAQLRERGQEARERGFAQVETDAAGATT